MFKRKISVCKRHQQRLVKKAVESIVNIVNQPGSSGITTKSSSYSSEHFDLVNSFSSDSENESSQDNSLHNNGVSHANITNFINLP